MEYVKICGLKHHEHAQLCIEHGADAVGFIYKVPSSPRNLKKKDLEILLKEINNEIATVIVLKPSNVNELEEIMNCFDATFFQIHINFDVNALTHLKMNLRKKIILALRVTQANKKDVIKKINNFHDQFHAILIDNSEGCGNELDLNTVKEILKNCNKSKVIVAGGITVQNIEHILNVLKPYGIDASSSLEFEKGVKDPLKIKEFLEKIKEIKNDLRG